jgi:hypothetical protein
MLDFHGSDLATLRIIGMDSGTQFAKIIISIMILVAFFAATAYKPEMGQDAERAIGALIAAFGIVWGYWLGSSE